LPAPLQRPFMPQLAAPSSTQMPIGSGLPAGRLVQVPSLPLTPQLWHEGHDTEPQQYPSTQLPFAHCAPPVQVEPLARLPTQLPPLQNELAAH
jgi:hypothetical protein